MEINTNQLLIQLYECGIDTEITTNEGQITVELTNKFNNKPIGISKNETLEQALAVIIRRLADDSSSFKEINGLKFNGLSRL